MGNESIINWILQIGGEKLNSINPGTLIPLVISILAGGSGCALLVLAWQKRRNEPVTASWLPAQGVVISSEIQEHSAINPQTNRTIFTPMVRYQYTCVGRSYTGYRISFRTQEYSRIEAQQIANRYTPGSPVTLYYDPLHPSEAVLEQNQNNSQSLFSIGLMLIVLGMALFIITLLIFWAEKIIH